MGEIIPRIVVVNLSLSLSIYPFFHLSFSSFQISNRNPEHSLQRQTPGGAGDAQKVEERHEIDQVMIKLTNTTAVLQEETYSGTSHKKTHPPTTLPVADA